VAPLISSLLTELLSLFAYPLGAALLVGAFALALTFTNWQRLGQILFCLALVVLWLASTPVCASWLTWRLESQFPPVSVAMLPQADAVIVLGGVIGQPLPPRVDADLGDPTDRVIEALRLYRASKAPLIVISAGNQPWQATLAPEAKLIADFLIELGTPRSALIVEDESQNTHENAVNTAALFKEQSLQNGLLVTSGAHMPRALSAFRKAGINVTPVSTDIHGGPINAISIFDVLPDAGSLARTTSAIKEMIGLWIYRCRGWA
jgi:uncharacterized SAM-binding protein YcdF (DUF218 family)